MSDLDGIRKRGVLDRRAGLTYFENPMARADVPTHTPEQFEDWLSLC